MTENAFMTSNDAMIEKIYDKETSLLRLVEETGTLPQREKMKLALLDAVSRDRARRQRSRILCRRILKRFGRLEQIPPETNWGTIDLIALKRKSLIRGWCRVNPADTPFHKRRRVLNPFSLDDVVNIEKGKMGLKDFGTSFNISDFLASSKPPRGKRRQKTGLKSIVSKRLLEDYYEPKYRVRFTPRRERSPSMSPDRTGWTVVEKTPSQHVERHVPEVPPKLTPNELWDKFIRERNERLASAPQ